MKGRIIFQEGNSFLHRVHPMLKLSWLLFLTIFVFVAPELWMVVALLFLIIASIPICMLQFGGLRGIRLLVTTAFMLALLQVIFNKQGEVLWVFGPLQVTSAGIETGFVSLPVAVVAIADIAIRRTPTITILGHASAHQPTGDGATRLVVTRRRGLAATFPSEAEDSIMNRLRLIVPTNPG